MSFKNIINNFIKLQPLGRKTIKIATEFATIIMGFWVSPDTQLYKVKSSVLDLIKKYTQIPERNF